MKKILALILVLVLVPVFALADLNYSSMTERELKDMIAACAAELRARNYDADVNGSVFVDEGGARIYQTGPAYISDSGRLEIPVIVFNDLDVSANFSFKNATVNDFSVQGYSYYSVPPHAKAICELDFSSDDIGLKSIDEVFSLRFSWVIYSPDTKKYVYEHPEIEEHRFW